MFFSIPPKKKKKNGWNVVHSNNIFVLFNSLEHLKPFQSYLNSCHVNISFTIVNEKDNRMSFLYVNIIREQGKFTTSVAGKPIFTQNLYSLWWFLPIHLQNWHNSYIAIYIYIYIYMCVCVCVLVLGFAQIRLSVCHLELVNLINVLKSKGYPDNFIKNCFRTLWDSKQNEIKSDRCA